MKLLTIKDFVELGYLQEVNRLFFHPRGLALGVSLDKEKYELAEILDARDDMEGFVFDESLSKKKAKQVELEYKKHLTARNKLFKTKRGIQPIEK
jgi:hypothetical protein